MEENSIGQGSGTTEVDLTSFAAGMYFVTIKNETQTLHSKFFKKH